MTVLRTARLTLRRAVPGDVGAMHDVLSDVRSMTYWSTPPHPDLETTQAWLDSMISQTPDQGDDFIIDLDGTAIGKMGAWRLPEFGFILASNHWGRGYASEAMTAFLDHAFARLDVPWLIADVDPRNTSSLRLLERHGFAETHRAQGTWETHIGRCDSVYLRLDREDWLKRRVSALRGE
jgi:[ribosomal protein S5]-alanine N-acetyltransferase